MAVLLSYLRNKFIWALTCPHCRERNPLFGRHSKVSWLLLPQCYYCGLYIITVAHKALYMLITIALCLLVLSVLLE